jgi:hypothetical protein
MVDDIETVGNVQASRGHLYDSVSMKRSGLKDAASEPQYIAVERRWVTEAAYSRRKNARFI